MVCAVGVLASGTQAYAQDFFLDYQSVQGETSALSASQFFVEGGVVSLQGTGNGTTMQVDAPAAVAVCGDGIREGVEDCDGNDFGALNCQVFGFSAGNLRCTALCTIESDDCTNANGTAEEGTQNARGGGHRGSDTHAVTTAATPAATVQRKTAPPPSVAEVPGLTLVAEVIPLPPANTALKRETTPTLSEQEGNNGQKSFSKPTPSRPSSAPTFASALEVASDLKATQPATTSSLLASLIALGGLNHATLFGIISLGLVGLLTPWMLRLLQRDFVPLPAHTRPSPVSSHRGRRRTNHCHSRKRA